MDPDLLNLEVRIAGNHDIAALARLRAEWTGVESDTEFEQGLARWLADEGERRTTWLARLNGRPAGMASLFEYRRMPRPGRTDSRWGYLGNMFVRERLRDRGIGSTLLATLVAAAEERGYARLVLSPSERAVAFYQRAGFVVPDKSAGNHQLLVRSIERR